MLLLAALLHLLGGDIDNYDLTLSAAIGPPPHRVVVPALQIGREVRISDTDIIQVALSPIWRDSPVFAARLDDPKLVGIWVVTVRDGRRVDGILMYDGRLWGDQEHYRQYWFVGGHR